MKEIAKFTGGLPFCGKHIVKKWYRDGVSAAEHGHTISALSNVALLSVFAYIHAFQLDLGITELYADKDAGIAEIGIDCAYSLANFLAAFSQAYLAFSILCTKQTSVGAPTSHTLGKATPFELGFTFGGQILFLQTMNGVAL